MNGRFCAVGALSLLVHLLAPAARAEEPLNFVVIFCDDLGYGDPGCFGHPTIRTPRIDRMAAEGLRLTEFYVAASVCTPSRAGLMTGRLPVRSGMCSTRRRVLFPDSKGGLPAGEVTIAEVLKSKGYATACIGKWHLGHRPEFLPTRHGFDSYWGIPYSNDMDRVPGAGPQGRAAFLEPKSEYWNVPIVSNEEEVERPADQTTITRRYTDRAVEYIGEHRDRPFFLYLAHNLPHVPLFASKEYLGTSERGLYGDVIEEIDASVGRVLDAIRAAEIEDRTVVVFTSDNGPWLVFDEHGGSAGPLREGKGSTWEGGMRVPCVVWGPGTIPAGRVSSEMASTLDLLPTFAALAGADIPEGRVLDGHDVSPLLRGTGPSPRREMIYYRGEELWAARLGEYKAHFISRTGYRGDPRVEHETPLLFHLGHDPSERFDVAKKHPEVIDDIRALVEKHRASVEPVECQLTMR